MQKKDYIPGSDSKLLTFAKFLVEYATANFALWKVQAPGGNLTDWLEAFEICLKKIENPNHGKVDILEKNEARKALVKELRVYVQGFLAKNPNVSNSDREKMGLTIYDTVPTAVTPPTGQAEGVITFPGRTQHLLSLKHSEGTPDDPKAHYGFRVYFGVYADGDTLPASGMDLRESRFTRQKKMLFGYLPTDTGKTAYYCIRYENSKGETGPWGVMVSALIP